MHLTCKKFLHEIHLHFFLVHCAAWMSVGVKCSHFEQQFTKIVGPGFMSSCRRTTKFHNMLIVDSANFRVSGTCMSVSA